MTVADTKNRKPIVNIGDEQAVYDAGFAHTCFMEQLLVQMEAAGIGQADLARMLKVSEPHIKQMFAGKNLTFEEASRLALAVGSHFMPRLRSKRQRDEDVKEFG